MKNLSKYYEIIVYGVVGASVTGLNIVLYYALSRYTPLHYTAANVLSFIIANIYAFFANKLFVFRSKSFEPKVFASEALGFAAARGTSCVIDLLIMFAGVGLLTLPDMWVKAAASAVIIVLNYIVSKFMIFKKGGKNRNAGYLRSSIQRGEEHPAAPGCHGRANQN